MYVAISGAFSSQVLHGALETRAQDAGLNGKSCQRSACLRQHCTGCHTGFGDLLDTPSMHTAIAGKPDRQHMPHTHTHMHTCARARTQTHAHTHARARAHTHHTRTQTHHTHKRTTHTHTHTHTHTYTHTRTHTHIHTYTHTHTGLHPGQGCRESSCAADRRRGACCLVGRHGNLLQGHLHA